MQRLQPDADSRDRDGELSAKHTTDPAIHIGNNRLGGVVTSANGPQAGVWVIVETTDLPNKSAKTAVTDDRGPYVMLDPTSKAAKGRRARWW